MFTRHVGSSHDPSAAGEHDGKHSGKRHDGVGAVVRRVTSCKSRKTGTTVRQLKVATYCVLATNLTSPTLTVQVVPQGGGVVARVAGVEADGLVARPLVGDDKITWTDRQRTDEDGQQGHGDHQQDDEGGARVDVGAHQTHKQTQQEDY